MGENDEPMGIPCSARIRATADRGIFDPGRTSPLPVVRINVLKLDRSDVD
jgi:hypothetical protein